MKTYVVAWQTQKKSGISKLDAIDTYSAIGRIYMAFGWSKTGRPLMLKIIEIKEINSEDLKIKKKLGSEMNEDKEGTTR